MTIQIKIQSLNQDQTVQKSFTRNGTSRYYHDQCFNMLQSSAYMDFIMLMLE